MSEIIALADRVAALSVPCRETDWLVAEAMGIVPEHRVTDGGTSWDWTRKLGHWWLIRVDEHGQAKTWSPWNYTASIDTVGALIKEKLPGWAWKVGTCCVSDDGWVVPDFNCPTHGERLRKQFGDFAAGSPEDTGIDIDRRPPGNPALALLEAFLRGYALHLSTAKPTTGE